MTSTEDPTHPPQEEQDRLRAEMARFGRGDRRKEVEAALVSLVVGAVVWGGTYLAGVYLADFEPKNVALVCVFPTLIGALTMWRVASPD